MTGWDDLYDAHARERWVEEPLKRVRAPERTPFERDRARVVHAASLRRLAAKTQVLGPGTDDFVRNRLTHSLEVAQVARDLAHPLGCHPDLAETAALAHDLGHPPFGHNGETVLDELGAAAGGFEGNAQTLRILTRLEAKSFDADGRSVGLNLTRATLDACTKYPWTRTDAPADRPGKFGVYDDDRAVFGWLRDGVGGARRAVEAQVMDVADDIAYSVHDLEDGVVLGGIDLALLDDPGERAAVFATVRELYLPDVDAAALEEALARVRSVGSWPGAAYDGSRRALASLKNLTSDLIGVFCGEVHRATVERHGPGPLARHRADLVVPDGTLAEVSVLKGVAAHYVMRSTARLGVMERQRQLVAELHEALVRRGEDAMDAAHAADLREAADDRGRSRVVLDQLASLTDASAVAWHARLCR
ncbi:deoxyguanosinetriphosphate triphosphohydrolase [Marmoricola sp. Leaf446]|uniref:deoxyguanosinetriphosphate triphosphohydrolase n=1 Tax=Marmoricola sp. Leaf446 TaxID=1736379 RepID=UPI0006F4E47A|nr:deoxyguanosinetriphosphate triphosphohydrolase [Marmoricola sp. Leaf446]KQT94293.1 deoxyguanosinetriphosphate triphosphohydrolase [Marmoricola sp. Leaf446]